jgi:hypothetical protein
VIYPIGSRTVLYKAAHGIRSSSCDHSEAPVSVPNEGATHSEPPRPTVSTCLRKPPQHRDELFEHELFKEVIQLVVASDEKRPTPKIARQPRRSSEGAA